MIPSAAPVGHTTRSPCSGRGIGSLAMGLPLTRWSANSRRCCHWRFCRERSGKRHDGVTTWPCLTTAKLLLIVDILCAVVTLKRGQEIAARIEWLQQVRRGELQCHRQAQNIVERDVAPAALHR